MSLLVVFMVLIGIDKINSLGNANDEISGSTYSKAAASQSLRFYTSDIGRLARNAILLKDESQRNKAIQDYRSERDAVDTLMALLTKQVSSPQGIEIFSLVKVRADLFLPFIDEVVALAQQGKSDEATQLLFGPRYKSQSDFMASIKELQNHQETRMSSSAAQARNDRSEALTILIAAGVVAVLLAAISALIISRSITRPLLEAVEAAGRVSRGDLSGTIHTGHKDETGILLSAIRDMQDSLINTVSQVRNNAESVASASSQIAQGNADLSQRTEEQASALEQTAASMEQLSATVRQSAENATQADELARGAAQVAVERGQKMGRVVSTMQAIHGSSRQIAEINGVIDGIAFQTNILALNAAVEAARAGEQGRGFAVVAGEVRTLAQRSADAARQIKALIAASVEQIESGSTLVDEAGATIDAMVEATQRVTALIGEIHVAAREQSTGVDQVRDAVGQMDHVTQQNAALVEESSAAAESLKMQSSQLVDAVSRFQVQPA